MDRSRKHKLKGIKRCIHGEQGDICLTNIGQQFDPIYFKLEIFDFAWYFQRLTEVGFSEITGMGFCFKKRCSEFWGIHDNT